jgi:hypothetical protein
MSITQLIHNDLYSPAYICYNRRKFLLVLKCKYITFFIIYAYEQSGIFFLGDVNANQITITNVLLIRFLKFDY